MKANEVLKHVDHTLLTQAATWEEIKAICDDGMKYETASACIPPLPPHCRRSSSPGIRPRRTVR